MGKWDDITKKTLVNNTASLAGVADDMLDIAGGATTATASTGALSTTLSGIQGSIGAFLTNPVTLTVAGVAAGLTAITAAYTYFATSYTRAQNSFAEKSAAFQTTKSEADALSSSLETVKTRMEALSALENAGTITLVEQNELNALRQSSAELERQLTIKQNLMEVQGNSQAAAARVASREELSSTELISDATGMSTGFVGFQQVLSKITGITSPYSGFETFAKENDTSPAGMLKNQMEAADKYKGKLDSLYDQRNAANSPKELDSVQKDIEKTEEAYASATQSIEQYSQQIQGWVDASYDADGKVLPESAAQVQKWKGLLTEVQNMGKTKNQKSENSLNNFFDGSPGKNLIKEELLAAAQAGGDLEKVLSGLGLSLSDLGKGVTGESLTNYFQNLAREAKEAEEASNGVDGSFEGVQAAQASQNQGYEWDAMSQNLKRGQELYESGAIGTDDFQTMAQWMAPGKIDTEGFKSPAEAYKKAWEDTYNTVSGWFNAENPVGSMWNFAEDLSAKNSDMFQVLNKETNEIIPNFKTTAEAADALEVSVGAVESILGKMQEYGYEFEGVLFSGEALDEYKQSLEGIRELAGGMEEGDRKEKLLGSLSLWDENYEKYQEDLSLLTEDQVVQIKFEYELAEIEQNIEYLREKASLTQSPEDWAELTLAQRDYRETREEQIGYNEDSDAGYGQSYDALAEIQDELRDAPENEIPVLEDQITAIYDLQTAFLDLRAAGEDMDWNTFLNSEEAQGTFDSIIEATGITREQLAEILGTEIPLPICADTEEAMTQIDTIEQMEMAGKIVQLVGQDDATPIMALWNTLQADPKFAALSANDQATYLVAYWNSLTPEQKQAVITATDNATPLLTDMDGKINTLNLNPTAKITATDTASSTVSFVSQSLAGLNGRSAHTYIYTHQINTGFPKLLGTAHKDGSSGNFSSFQMPSNRALAMGTLQDNSWLKPKWKTKQDEVALTGEVGQELVVHGNRWWTVGDQGAEFSPIPQGSVVFNARQTRDLLNKGFTNSRGTAHLSGTAYASGSTDQAAKDALKELSNYFNWITINMDRLSRQSKLASNAIETAVGLSEKQTATSEAISKVREERNAATQGSKKYLEHAEWYARESGLSADLQKKVQNGTIDISKYDEDTQAKIKEYQQYYEKYLDMLDKATDLEKKESDLVEKRLKNIESFYKLVTKVSESVQDMNDAKLKYEAAKGYSAVSDQVKAVYQSSLKESQNTYNSLSKQLVDYQTEFDTLVKNGSITKGSDQWYEGLAKINGFQEDIYKAGVTIVEYEDKIRGIEYTKLENLISGFERAVKSLDGRMSLKKARDEKISESDYQTNINLNNSTIRENMKLRDKKLKEQSLYDVNSKEYQDLTKDISSLDKETYNLLVDNEKLKDSIFELRFAPLDEGIEKYQDLRSELRNFQELLNKDAFFDKNGAITETGLANLALLQQQLATTKKEIADYRTGLDKLSESYKNGVISEKEYNEKSQEYREGIQDAAGDVVDYQEKLTDLYMTQMKAEVDALQEVIDKRKDALDAKADYYDYDKKLKSQTKDVNVLKAQIAAMEGVNDAATQAKVKQLRQQLADAEDKLGETKRDHAIDMQKEGYNGLSNDMEKMLDDTEYEIIHNSEKQQSVIESMLSNVVNMYESAYGKINSIIANTGWVGSTDFNTTQSQLSTQTGAANQTTSAAQSQSSTKASSTATSTKTSSINNDDASHKNTEAELAKPENTTNRLVAEVTLSTTSVTLEEGQTTTVSAQSIRPTDAKNKNLSWTSNNSQIATVSNGTIRALKPGSCQIIASTKDGSKINASVNVTVTKKPDPPKPQPKPAAPKSGGDGVPNIGDAVTFANGIYYLDSYGTAPSGNQMMGQTVYITYMNPGAPKPIHISRTKTPGERDLGWLSLSQLKGYKSGSKNIDTEQLAWTQEDGRELIMRKSDGAMLTKLSPGDAVAPNHLTENLFKWGEVNPKTFFANTIDTAANVPVIGTGQNVTIEQHYDSLIHVEGNVDQDVLADLKAYEKDFLDKSYKYTTNMIAKDCQKVGIRRK
ncbi:Ig-like domain-containing protein [Faecalicatena contorta]|uniref:Ig-like domain (Group 2) n=1 Tax=Faecalicatena contorta TaxID=39482 RepID=A0A316A330_9FIRM|nr:Ig-like domain-containing protein [Faecalicatena contorta]PWJ51114.1 Ig-like protein group 2 [Faecalicatena contorta]SUQ13682.1 Ig-like domain (group 2) [Faecalicatena contorta]